MTLVLVRDLVLDVDLGAQILNLALCMEMVHWQALYLALNFGILRDHRG